MDEQILSGLVGALLMAAACAAGIYKGTKARKADERAQQEGTK